MNKQFALLALATISMSLGSAPLSFANTASVPQSALVISQAEEKPLINVAKVSLGSLKLGMTQKQVTKILGKPRSVKKEHDANECLAKDSFSSKYRNLDILFENGRVEKMAITSKFYATNEGIKVGDPISKAKKIYGRKFGLESFYREDNKEYSLSYSNESYGGISFNANQQGIITEIGLLAQACS